MSIFFLFDLFFIVLSFIIIKKINSIISSETSLQTQNRIELLVIFNLLSWFSGIKIISYTLLFFLLLSICIALIYQPIITSKNIIFKNTYNAHEIAQKIIRSCKQAQNKHYSELLFYIAPKEIITQELYALYKLKTPMCKGNLLFITTSPFFKADQYILVGTEGMIYGVNGQLYTPILTQNPNSFIIQSIQYGKYYNISYKKNAFKNCNSIQATMLLEQYLGKIKIGAKKNVYTKNQQKSIT